MLCVAETKRLRGGATKILLTFPVRGREAASRPRVWGGGTACALPVALGEQQLVFEYLGLSQSLVETLGAVWYVVTNR